ncbi:MAG: hypothetical protein HY655_11045 [Acidobacteria bacterium]|nr:hypothetical protein [Acidobacteriota bacterium]
MLAVPHQLAFQTARQVQVTREYLARIDVTRALGAFTLRPARVVAAITAALCRMRFARISGFAAEVPPVIVPVLREPGRPAPLVISFVVAIRAASPAAVARRSTVFVA